MSMESGTAFLAEIGIASFNFAPKGWAMCNGQLLPINQNQGLFSLLGTTYGGDGRVNFALPDLRGRVPMHMGSSGTGSSHTLGERAGEENHTLNMSEMPQHVHAVNASTTQALAGTGPTPANTKILGQARGSFLYSPASGLNAMDSREIGNAGGSQPHLNQQPYLVLNFCIALQGIFPSQT